VPSVAGAAAATTPHARHVLGVGCGAGNYTLKPLERLPNLDATAVGLFIRGGLCLLANFRTGMT
jgi:hypothetical protein